MPQYYDDKFKKKIVRLKLEQGRTAKSIISEYGVSKASITKWCQEFREECQSNKWATMIRNWAQAYGELSIIYEGRLPE